MKILRKISLGLVVLLFTISMSGCKKIENRSLEKKMEKLYVDIKKEDLPKLISNIEITEKNIKYYLGVDDIKYKSGLAKEGMLGAGVHSVVLLKVKKGKAVEDIKDKIKENINPKRWIFFGIEKEDVVVESNGKLIMVALIENEVIRNKIKDSFNNL